MVAKARSKTVKQHGTHTAGRPFHRAGGRGRGRRGSIVAAVIVTLIAAYAGPAVAVVPTGPTAARAAKPVITGVAQVGSTLRANLPGPKGSITWAHYQWRADGSPIVRATRPTLAVAAGQVGHRLSVTVTGRRAGGQTYRATSVPTSPVVVGSFQQAPTPTISGVVALGQTLRVDPGDWGPAHPSLRYQWFSKGNPIGGATTQTYQVDPADIGGNLGVSVTADAPGYTAATTSSAPTESVPTPAVYGTAATQTQRMTQSTLNSTQEGWYAQGARLKLECYQRGQAVQGYFSSSFPSGWDDLWYRIDDGHYAADVDLETGTLDPVVPACADQPVADTTNARVMARTQRQAAATLNSAQSGWYEAGTRITLSCYVHGQPVQGYFSSSFPSGYDDLWYKVSDGYWAADIDLETGSNTPVTGPCTAPPPDPGDTSTIITRARSWIDAAVPYDWNRYYTNSYGSYRQDCSGLVSMALGLPSSYTTVTLPAVMHRISKDDLQPGDFMLNTAAGGNGHVSIFMGWTDASHTSYTSWEENGQAGRAFAQVVPYPYWTQWGGYTQYFPYRKN